MAGHRLQKRFTILIVFSFQALRLFYSSVTRRPPNSIDFDSTYWVRDQRKQSWKSTTTKKSFDRSRTPYYSAGTTTFHSVRLKLIGTVHTNPGPTKISNDKTATKKQHQQKNKTNPPKQRQYANSDCIGCERKINKNHRVIAYNDCHQELHIKWPRFLQSNTRYTRTILRRSLSADLVIYEHSISVTHSLRRQLSHILTNLTTNQQMKPCPQL